VSRRTDIRFVRNGKEYSSTQAADFLRGKLQWRIDKVATAQDFIEQVGTRSTASGEAYLVRLANGQTVPSAHFLAQELRRLGKH
jgi:aminoglycoside phosphotransferase (APT) family kinase protein